MSVTDAEKAENVMWLAFHGKFLEKEHKKEMIDRITGSGNKGDVQKQSISFCDKYGRTKLILAIRYAECYESIANIIKRGDDVNARQNNGGTALMTAAKYSNNVEIVKLLLDNGANIFATTDAGTNIFQFAYENRTGAKAGIIDLLSRYIAEISLGNIESNQKCSSVLSLAKKIGLGYLNRTVFCENEYFCIDVGDETTMKIPILKIETAYKNKEWNNITNAKDYTEIYALTLAKECFKILHSSDKNP